MRRRAAPRFVRWRPARRPAWRRPLFTGSARSQSRRLHRRPGARPRRRRGDRSPGRAPCRHSAGQLTMWTVGRCSRGSTGGTIIRRGRVSRPMGSRPRAPAPQGPPRDCRSSVRRSRSRSSVPARTSSHPGRPAGHVPRSSARPAAEVRATPRSRRRTHGSDLGSGSRCRAHCRAEA
jgi:hypothetical protein